MTFSRRPGERFNRGRIATQFGAGNGPNFAALGAAFWDDISNPSSYTASGSNITGIRSLVSGTLRSTVVGTPTLVTDLRDGKPGIRFTGSAAPAYVMGADAPYIAAVVGTDRPGCSIEVVWPDDADANGVFDSVCNSASTVIRAFAQLTPSFTEYQIGSLGYKPAASEFVVAGLNVIVHHSADGLNWYTSVNGAAETLATITSAGVLTLDRIGTGATANAAPSLPYGGMYREKVYFGTDKTRAEYLPWVTSLLSSKWRPPPQVMMIGDSISTASLSTNGGMAVLLANAVRAAGGTIDMQGPIAVPNGSGGQVWYPHRISAVSGNTCPDMNTRVSSVSQGLGLGGGSRGAYRRTKLVCLMAGTNPVGGAPGLAATTLTDYATLLDNIYTRLQQSDPTAMIAVTFICEVTSNLAYSQAVNTGLPAVWAASAAGIAGKLLYWNANAANPNDGSNTYFYDGTHPNNAGYVRMCNDPTNGLIQAVLPYLTSIQ